MENDSPRLRLLYEVNRRLAVFTDLDELLRYATRRARELFDAEGCAVLLVDAQRREFHFPVASQRESRASSAARLAEVRFPVDRGVAGWVLAHDEATAVPDTASDPRFYSGVDHLTDATTRAILCAPLRMRAGNIGVLEVINPAAGARREDLEFLETLANDIAVAHEKARLYEQLRGEVVGLRQVCGLAGLALALIGIAFVVGATYAHVARALPWGELPARPGVLMGIAAAAGGALLTAVGRGWLVRRARS
jgi:GAF domain-containing protein